MGKPVQEARSKVKARPPTGLAIKAALAKSKSAPLNRKDPQKDKVEEGEKAKDESGMTKTSTKEDESMDGNSDDEAVQCDDYQIEQSEKSENEEEVEKTSAPVDEMVSGDLP